MAKIDPFDIFTNPNHIKETQNALIKMFSPYIKESFLKQMLNLILSEHPEILRHFDFSMSHESIVSGISDNAFEYELCRNIVAIHRFNCIGLSDSERVLEEKEDGYKSQLSYQVLDQIKLRNYASVFFRRKRFVLGEDWAFYPLNFKLFAICIKANEILREKYKGPYFALLSNLFNKILCALTIIEDNFMDNAYPIARGAIEIYLKFLVLLDYPQAVEKHDRFMQYEIEKTAHNGENPEAFLDEYDHRVYSKGNPVEFMHFGWLDDIPNYHAIVKERPYTIGGIISYLTSMLQDKTNNYFDLLGNLYSRCHGFTHGNIGNTGYPLLHYIDLMMILANIGRHSFILLKQEAGDDGLINGIDPLETFNDDLSVLTIIFNSKSTEMFETFHKYKK